MYVCNMYTWCLIYAVYLILSIDYLRREGNNILQNICDKHGEIRMWVEEIEVLSLEIIEVFNFSTPTADSFI